MLREYLTVGLEFSTMETLKKIKNYKKFSHDKRALELGIYPKIATTLEEGLHELKSTTTQKLTNKTNNRNL